MRTATATMDWTPRAKSIAASLRCRRRRAATHSALLPTRLAKKSFANTTSAILTTIAPPIMGATRAPDSHSITRSRQKNMRFLPLLLLLAATLAQAQPDYAREQRWADEINPGLVVGDAVYLNQKSGHKFLAI